ncbi:patatin-like phospholipase family protein [Luteimonas sp. MC1782]|uniref:patatin-like phospholipase family protein n=1 Tax=Luteimonas sp. MC1782 TaxID=2760305 RepID=UPI0015FF5F5F|nr:patatin-like phospholipase family protein [Luteimonas sp. MC1782]MBB1471597.1 patatin-like phospholipase family protein [Luteimonas sp. MC1782]
MAPRKRRTRATARPLSLALQGGGAHGAFTWGVLDALLEDGRFDLCGASGTSAGAMNAVVLAHGLLEGGRDGARDALSRFWSAVGGNASLLHVGAGASDGRPSPMASLMLQWSGFLAPAQFNPMGYDPLRDIVEAQVDFERLRAEPGFDLFIAATHANTGRLRLFRTAEISADAVLASACLPALYQAVEIDGEPYWDGAFAANPPVLPLLAECRVDDVLMVLLNPATHGATPRTASDIRDRSQVLAFNAAFLAEMRSLVRMREFMRRSIVPWLVKEHPVRRKRLHLIADDALMARLDNDSRSTTSLPFLETLRDHGRSCAQAWLAGDAISVGKRSTVDVAGFR